MRLPSLHTWQPMWGDSDSSSRRSASRTCLIMRTADQYESARHSAFSKRGVCVNESRALPVGSAMAVLMPIRRPLLLSSTPPELPGLMAASVWMTFLMGTPLKPGVASSRPSPDTIPCSAHTWRQLFGHRTAATWLCAACRESNHSAAEASFGWAGCFAFGKPRLQGFTQLRNKSGGVIHVCAVPR